jgi:hypothetical protein
MSTNVTITSSTTHSSIPLEDQLTPIRALDLARMFLGPASAGLSIGLRSGVATSLMKAMELPLVLGAVAVLMVPALYIAGALVGIAPSARALLSHAIDAMKTGSVVLVGLAPASAFLTITSADPAIAAPLGLAALGLAAVVAFRSLYRGMFEDLEEHGRALILFFAWAFVATGIGGKLVYSALVG